MSWLADNASNISGLLASISAALMLRPLFGVRSFRKNLRVHLDNLRRANEQTNVLSRIQHVEDELANLHTWSLIPALVFLVGSIVFSVWSMVHVGG